MLPELPDDEPPEVEPPDDDPPDDEEPPEEDPPEDDPPDDEPPPFPPPPPPPRRLSRICSWMMMSAEDRIARDSAAFGAGMLREAARGGNSNTVIAGTEQRILGVVLR